MDQDEIEKAIRLVYEHERHIHGTQSEPGILTRIKSLEVGKIVSDAAWAAVRWGFPIVVTGTGILLAAYIGTR